MPCNISYGKVLFIAVDQLVNTLFLGWPDETISSRAWRWHQSGKRSWPMTLINAIFFWDKDKASGKRHCELAFESERAGRQMPPEARK